MFTLQAFAFALRWCRSKPFCSDWGPAKTSLLHERELLFFFGDAPRPGQLPGHRRLLTRPPRAAFQKINHSLIINEAVYY
jgi:hypothetical protein